MEMMGRFSPKEMIVAKATEGLVSQVDGEARGRIVGFDPDDPNADLLIEEYGTNKGSVITNNRYKIFERDYHMFIDQFDQSKTYVWANSDSCNPMVSGICRRCKFSCKEEGKERCPLFEEVENNE